MKRAPQPTLRVGFWNLLSEFESREVPQCERSEEIVHVLNAHPLDVLGLVEARQPTIDLICGELGMVAVTQCPYINANVDGQETQLAILTRSEIDATASETIYVQATPTEIIPIPGVKYGDVELKILHLPHQLQKAYTRRKAVKQILRVLGNSSSIIMGDFNEPRFFPGRKHLSQSSYTSAVGGLANRRTFPSDAHRGNSLPEWLCKLEEILKFKYNVSLDDIYSRDINTLRSQIVDPGKASDHFMVLASYALQRAQDSVKIIEELLLSN